MIETTLSIILALLCVASIFLFVLAVRLFVETRRLFRELDARIEAAEKNWKKEQ